MLRASPTPGSRNSIELRIDVPDNLRIKADGAMMEKVVSNLLENAAKYSKPGSPITISAEETKDKVLLSIADQGVGIEPSEQALIFERFYRGRSQTLWNLRHWHGSCD